MPSALETLVKILKLEQDTGYKDTAVIGGLASFGNNWARDAHQQAKRPEHHALVDELVQRMADYGQLGQPEQRRDAIRYMLDRITGRVRPPVEAAPPGPTVPALDAPPPENTPPKAAETPAELPAPTFGTPVRTPQTAPTAPPAEVETREAVPAVPAPEPQPGPVPPPPTPAEPLGEGAPSRASQLAPAPAAARRGRRSRPSYEEAVQRLAELQKPITALHKVGEKMAEKLEKLGIRTLEDMLLTLPRRYDDYTRLQPLHRLVPGETVTVVAEVRAVLRRQAQSGRPYILVTLDDGTAQLNVTFFGQPWLIRQFKRGSQVVMSGTVELFRGERMMTNPEWEMLEREHIHTNRIVPVYPLTKGLSARTMRRLMREAVEEWGRRVPDYLPDSVLDRTQLADLAWAIEQAHFPDTLDTASHARQRLAFDELFVFQMSVLSNRRDWQSVPGQPLPVSSEWLNAFTARLPYQLTGAQRRALEAILRDLAADVPMNRLLQGDVGSGKTVVAAMALAAAAANGKQAALMAPTSILAEQHARSLTRILGSAPGAPIEIRLLTGSTSEADRAEIREGLASGRIQVLIGTHALIEEGVEFRDLALAVIDEQHRFGVVQRGALRGKGTNPHLLVMTATPIPRTLALTVYADLDLSVIDEMPPGRTPVETRVVRPVERERAYSFIHAQLDKGRQVFVVYPLVETSDALEEVGAATEEYERLRKTVFRKRRVGLLHGRMSPTEKDQVMSAFAAGEIDVLVSTSVVEVGIDVPNASIIVVENAERFGLAQLHQFRGRVGRGEHKSFCLLVAGDVSGEAGQRLQAMEETTDGFRLAEIDWQLRGAGDLLGLRQSGGGQFRLAELMNPRLVELAQREARTIYAEDPRLAQPEHRLLAQRVEVQVNRRADVS